MRVAWSDFDDRAGLRGYVQFDKYTHTHTQSQTHIYKHKHTNTNTTPSPRPIRDPPIMFKQLLPFHVVSHFVLQLGKVNHLSSLTSALTGFFTTVS